MHTKMQRKKKKDSVLDKFIDSKLVFLISFINRKKKKKKKITIAKKCQTICINIHKICSARYLLNNNILIH